MPVTLMDLPSELLSKIFAFVFESDLPKLRLVNAAFRRVATPLAFSVRQIDLSNAKRLKRFDDTLSPASQVLAHTKRLTIRVNTYNMNIRDFEIAKMFTPAIFRLSQKTNDLTVDFPAASSFREWSVELNQIVWDQLVLLPAVRRLNLLRARYTVPDTMIPSQLTYLLIFDFPYDRLMNRLVTMLDHLPQLVTLNINTRHDRHGFNEIDGKRLVDWVQNVMEQKNKQHLMLKELSFTFGLADFALHSQDYEAMLAYFFFTLPNMHSMHLCVQHCMSLRPEHPTTHFQLSPSIVARSGFPKYLKISVPGNALLGDAKHDGPGYSNSMSQMHTVEHLCLTINMKNILYPWLHCFPLDGIKKLELRGAGRTNDGDFTLQRLAKMLQLVPRLETLEMRSMTLLLGKENVALPLLLSLENLEFLQCNLDTLQVLEKFADQSPRLTRLRLYYVNVYDNQEIMNQSQPTIENQLVYHPRPIDNPWMPKLQTIMQESMHYCSWTSAPVANLSLHITGCEVGLYIFLQDHGFAKTTTPLIFLCHGKLDARRGAHVAKICKLTHDETLWLLNQIDRMYTAYENGGNDGLASKPLCPTGVHEDIWILLQKRFINVIACLSLNLDKLEFYR